MCGIGLLFCGGGRLRRPGEVLVYCIIRGKGVMTDLVGRVDEGICHNDVLPASSVENNNLGNILWSQWVASSIDSIRLSLITIISDNREVGLDLSGIDVHDSDSCSHQLFSQCVGERLDCCLGGAVDAASGVWLATGDGADVDDVSASAFVALLVDLEDGLGHVD